MFGFSSRPVPFYASVYDAESALSSLELQLHTVKTQLRVGEFFVYASTGSSVTVPAGHPDGERICDALENMLLFDIRHCRKFINERTAL